MARDAVSPTMTGNECTRASLRRRRVPVLRMRGIEPFDLGDREHEIGGHGRRSGGHLARLETGTGALRQQRAGQSCRGMEIRLRGALGPARHGGVVRPALLARRRSPITMSADVDAIDALLPQTQCTRCGYTGCLPYAEAIARGEAGSISARRAAPRPSSRWRSSRDGRRCRSTATTESKPRPRWRSSTKRRCIGCTKCLPPCPVDAIVGAPRRMHTVVAELCTGCELCVAPCPVDCIVMIPLLASPLPALTLPPADGSRTRYRGPQRTGGAPCRGTRRDARRQEARRAKDRRMNSRP